MGQLVHLVQFGEIVDVGRMNTMRFKICDTSVRWMSEIHLSTNTDYILLVSHSIVFLLVQP